LVTLQARHSSDRRRRDLVEGTATRRDALRGIEGHRPSFATRPLAAKAPVCCGCCQAFCSRSFRCPRAAGSLLRRRNIQVVNAHFPRSRQWLSSSCSKHLRILYRGKIVLTFHGADITETIPPAWFQKRLAISLITRAGGVVACSGRASPRGAAKFAPRARVTTISQWRRHRPLQQYRSRSRDIHPPHSAHRKVRIQNRQTFTPARFQRLLERYPVVRWY